MAESSYINYCDLPHLLQNLACTGIDALQTIQFFVVIVVEELVCGFGSSISTGLNVGSCGEGSVYSLPLAAEEGGGPTVPPVPTKPPMPKPACGADGTELSPVGLLIDVPFSMAVLISNITRTARKFSADVATSYSPILAKNSLSLILPCLYSWFASINDSYISWVSLTSCLSFSVNAPRVSTPKDIKK